LYEEKLDSPPDSLLNVMRELLADWTREYGRTGGGGKVVLDEEEIEELRALGYLY